MADDAVIVLPGIMGSELIDNESGRTLWGLSDPRWYVRAWTRGTGLTPLEVTDDERAGRTGRVTASRLLKFPAFAPVLRGFEPYTALSARLRHLLSPDAVLEFPYDWRLSVEHNARLLASAAEQHLSRWRVHADRPEARLVLVAHSMGGLVARYFTEVLGGAELVRAVVTLGTPFYGAVKAVGLLSSGRGAPLPMPRQRVRALVSTLPGVHDLLPSYRCVDEGDTVRRLTAADVAGIGGDAELAAESFARRELLLAGGSGVRWWPLVGVEQETAQSMTLDSGVALTHQYTCEAGADGGVDRVDRRGDGTVFRDGASTPGTSPMHVPQTHGALAARAEGIAHAYAVVTARETGPWLAGEARIGLRVPEVVTAGVPFELHVTGDVRVSAVTCVVADVGTRRLVDRPALVRREGVLMATATVPDEGLYRVEAKAGGLSAVTELVMAVRP